MIATKTLFLCLQYAKMVWHTVLGYWNKQSVHSYCSLCKKLCALLALVNFSLLVVIL